MENPATPPPARLHWSALTDRGRFRANNEDAFLALAFDGHEVRYLGKTGQASLAGADYVFAVSDGMGGAKSGEFASRIAVDRITRLLPRAFRMSAAGLASGFNDVLTELFLSIHADLLKLGSSYDECSGMGATLSLGWFTPEWMYFAHLGDSRIYYLPHSGGLTQLTHDHSQGVDATPQPRLEEGGDTTTHLHGKAAEPEERPAQQHSHCRNNGAFRAESAVGLSGLGNDFWTGYSS